mgnify:FL=1
MHINKMFTLCYIINMVSDADRQITRISYDQQNLPRRIDYLDGSHVDYTYDADGGKLRVDYELNTCSTVLLPPDEDVACDSSACVHIWREYVGNNVYENDTLRMVLTDGGYITFDEASHLPLYHYYAKDYLGNNRVVVDEAGRIEEINHYYPFGGLMGDSHNTATQPYKYIGKELDRTHGLDWYDHGARHYDPVTGRWNVADAMAEKYYSLSPYVSCGDDPVVLIDVNGREWGILQNSDGTIVIYLNVSLTTHGFSKEMESLYKQSLTTEFSRMISEASESKASGIINFDVPQNAKQLNIFLFWTDKYSGNTAGMTNMNSSTVSRRDARGNIKSAEQFAYDNIHELLHTLRMPDLTNGNFADVTIKHIDGLNFETVGETSSDIINNVMNYSFNYINGIRYMDITPLQKQTITKHQYEFIKKEIRLQQNGAGNKGSMDEYWNY